MPLIITTPLSTNFSANSNSNSSTDGHSDTAPSAKQTERLTNGRFYATITHQIG
ncbi:hypothetical protein [Shewanella colwelliana]|uniref:hypothetical protein n=1 Tax=Shewanella colwelliana TaxID=23 RepID=UPI001586DABC|nr:hypothetical protein [Shewanella colwelliana]